MAGKSGQNNQFYKTMEIKIAKSDFLKAAIAGAIIALFSLPVLKNLNFFAYLSLFWSYIFLSVWMLLLPPLSGVTLFLSYKLALFSKKILFFEVGKYGLIGALNTLISGGIFNLLMAITGVAVGLTADFFIAISFSAAITHSFFWNKFWIFKAHSKKEIKKEYFKFFAVSGAVALLNLFLMHILINIVGNYFNIEPKIWANISIGILIPISFFGNFFGYKTFVFCKAQE